MAKRTFAENVAQAKADFKKMRDGIGKYFDSVYDEPTSTYGDYPDNIYSRGADEAVAELMSNYQENGTRTNYNKGFAGRGWTDDLYSKIVYDITVRDGYSMYSESRISKVGKAIKLDTIRLYSLNNMFYKNTVLTHIYSNIYYGACSTDVKYVFQGATALKYIKGFLSNNGTLQWNVLGSLKYQQVFDNCTSLTTIENIDTINGNGWDIHWSPLDEATVGKIVNALADKSGDTSGKTWKIILGSKNTPKLTTEQKAEILTKGWFYE